MTDWAGRVQRLEAEVSGLRRAMRSRGLIEQAKGRLAERLGVDAERAFQLLSQLSQESNVRVVDMAAQVMGTPAPAEAEGDQPVVTPADLPADGWVDSVVDVLDEPVLVLSPLWTDTRIDDFRIDHANPSGVRLWGLSGGSPVGRRLVDTAPEVAVDGTLELLAQAYDGGPVGGADTVRAARVGDRLMASWPSTGRADLGWIEEMGGLGWGQWSRTSAPLEFSAGLYRVLERDPADGPLSLDQVIALMVPADRSRARGLVGGRELPSSVPAAESSAPAEADVTSTVDVSLARTGRRLRMFVLPQLDPGGHLLAVLALFQDVTENRRMSALVDQLTVRQLHAAVERAQNEQLRAALYPAPQSRTNLGPLQVLARHAAPAEMGRFRGDFYEVCRAGPGLTVVVGDVFGSGIGAATTMVRLRHAARALALAGHGPGEMLRLLNAELCADEQPPMASLVIASVDPNRLALRWAQAGHFSPITLRGGRARALRRPRGSVVGLLPDSTYGELSHELRPDDVVVLFTDGVFQRWEPDTDRPRRLAAQCLAAQREGGVEAVLHGLVQPTGDEACVVAIQCA